MLRRWLVDNPVLDLSLMMAVLIVGYDEWRTCCLGKEMQRVKKDKSRNRTQSIPEG